MLPDCHGGLAEKLWAPPCSRADRNCIERFAYLYTLEPGTNLLILSAERIRRLSIVRNRRPFGGKQLIVILELSRYGDQLLGSSEPGTLRDYTLEQFDRARCFTPLFHIVVFSGRELCQAEVRSCFLYLRAQN